MNVGIVVYSWSGHTLEVAEKVRDKLSGAGHSVTLERIAVVGERKQGAREFRLEPLPDIAAYDAVIFGAAVEAFSLSPVMTKALKQMGSLAGKKIACLVTQQFPFPWMGGNRAIGQMKKLCRAKGGAIAGAAVVNWAKSRRAGTTAAAVERLTRLL